jgi:hypothetical protein
MRINRMAKPPPRVQSIRASLTTNRSTHCFAAATTRGNDQLRIFSELASDQGCLLLLRQQILAAV